MQCELCRNNLYQSVELLLLVSLLFLLAIPKCLLTFEESFYYTIYLASKGNRILNEETPCLPNLRFLLI